MVNDMHMKFTDEDYREIEAIIREIGYNDFWHNDKKYSIRYIKLLTTKKIIESVPGAIGGYRCMDSGLSFLEKKTSLKSFLRRKKIVNKWMPIISFIALFFSFLAATFSIIGFFLCEK